MEMNPDAPLLDHATALAAFENIDPADLLGPSSFGQECARRDCHATAHTAGLCLVHFLDEHPAAMAHELAWKANFGDTAAAHAVIETAAANRTRVEYDAQRCPACLALPGGGVCEDHYGALTAAFEAQRQAIAAHAESVERFKAGVTVAQVQRLLGSR